MDPLGEQVGLHSWFLHYKPSHHLVKWSSNLFRVGSGPPPAGVGFWSSTSRVGFWSSTSRGWVLVLHQQGLGLGWVLVLPAGVGFRVGSGPLPAVVGFRVGSGPLPAGVGFRVGSGPLPAVVRLAASVAATVALELESKPGVFLVAKNLRIAYPFF